MPWARLLRRAAPGPALLVLLAVFVAAPLGAETKGEISLDAQRRAALAELPPLTGGPLAPGDLDGEVVVLAFFASWCPPCHPEFDNLNEVAAAYDGRGVQIVAVNIFESFGNFADPDRLQAFLADKAPSFAVVGDGERVASLFGDVERIPTVFVFDRGGRPVLHFVHARGAEQTHVTAEELHAAVRAAL